MTSKYVVRSLAAICILLLAAGAGNAAEYAGGVQARLLLETSSTSDGSPIAYPRSDKPLLTVMRVLIPPGTETGWHQHPVPLYAYLLQGTVAIRLEDGRSFTFKAGEPIVEVVDTLHNGRAGDDGPAELLVFYLGEKGKANVLKK